jgi:hypothetical protein
VSGYIHTATSAQANNCSAGLTVEDSQQVLSKLLVCRFILHLDLSNIAQSHLVSRPESGAATRKLCSTLAQYFCKPISTWTSCIRSLTLSLAHGQPLLDEAIESYPTMWEVIPQLPENQLLLLLDFSMTLADEAKKLSNSPEYENNVPIPGVVDILYSRTTQERMIANAKDVEPLLHESFRRGLQYASSGNLVLGEQLCFAALKCFVVCQ